MNANVFDLTAETVSEASHKLPGFDGLEIEKTEAGGNLVSRDCRTSSSFSGLFESNDSSLPGILSRFFFWFEIRFAYWLFAMDHFRDSTSCVL